MKNRILAVVLLMETLVAINAPPRSSDGVAVWTASAEKTNSLHTHQSNDTFFDRIFFATKQTYFSENL